MKEEDLGRHGKFATITFDTGCITRYVEDFIDVTMVKGRHRTRLA